MFIPAIVSVLALALAPATTEGSPISGSAGLAAWGSGDRVRCMREQHGSAGAKKSVLLSVRDQRASMIVQAVRSGNRHYKRVPISKYQHGFVSLHVTGESCFTVRSKSPRLSFAWHGGIKVPGARPRSVEGDAEPGPLMTAEQMLAKLAEVQPDYPLPPEVRELPRPTGTEGSLFAPGYADMFALSAATCAWTRHWLAAPPAGKAELEARSALFALGGTEGFRHNDESYKEFAADAQGSALLGDREPLARFSRAIC